MTHEFSREPYQEEVQARFFERIRRLSQNDEAILRSNLGRRLHEAREGYLLIAQLTGAADWIYRPRDDYFLAATCVVSAPEWEKGGNFGASLRTLARAVSYSLDESVEALLRTDRESLNRAIAPFVRDLKTHRLGLNRRALLQDVLSWTIEDRPVQRRWADAFIG